MVQPKLATFFVIAATVAVGVFFFLVVQPFILPLILAAVLAVLFWPWYESIRKICYGHDHAASAMTTAVILLIVLIPVGAALALAGAQLVSAAQQLDDEQQIGNRLAQITDDDANLGGWIDQVRSRVSQEDVQQIRQMLTQAIAGTAQTIYSRTTQFAANLIGFVIGLIVLTLGLYYFLAEKDTLLAEVRRLSPFDEGDDIALQASFVRVCRGVLLGTVLAALVQALLNGIGFAIAGVSHVWLLALLTFFLSMVPFLGAASVWSVVAIGLAIDGRYWAAAFFHALLELMNRRMKQPPPASVPPIHPDQNGDKDAKPHGADAVSN